MKFLLERKKEIALGLILCAIAFVTWRNFQDESPVVGGGARGTAGRTDLTSLKLYAVDWASLAAKRPAYVPGRNIFQFGVIPPPPPPVLSPAEQAAIADAQRRAEEERQRQLREAQEAGQKAAEESARLAAIQAQLPPPPPPKPQPPPVNYKFIGYFGPPEQKIAILHDGTDMILVRKGDVVGKDFKIVEIGYESIKFGFTDPQFRGESQTIPMSSSF